MKVKTPPLAPLARGLWLLYLCGALLWLCGLSAAGWRFWAVALGVAALQPACSALGAALERRRGRYVAGADVLARGTRIEVFAVPPLDGRLLPASYTPAEWRGTLPVDSRGRLGLSFNLEGGDVLRLSLDLRSARHVSESVDEYLRGHELRPAPGNAAGPSPALRDRG